MLRDAWRRALRVMPQAARAAILVYVKSSASSRSIPAEDAARTSYALLLDSLDDEHEVAVVRGAIAGAREDDAVLLCIAGGVVGDPDPQQNAKNFVFDLVPPTVRGVLVLSSAIGWAIDEASMKIWLGRFRALPTCCLGVPIDSHSSVTVDNIGGIQSAVLHLIRAHSARRIAFVRGPHGSSEAEDRLASFQNTLTGAGLEADPRLVVDGDFTKASGVRAVSTLLDERHITLGALDAIIAANDYMAIGAIEELSRRDILVPEQVAVVGFDDVDSARMSRPTLTTVRQPDEAIGSDGVRQLVLRRRGQSPEMCRVLPTELIVRRSCGCTDPGIELATSSHLPASGVRFEASFVQRRQIILAEVMRAAHGNFGAAGAAWESRLFDALVGELRGQQAGGFSRAMAQLLRRIERTNVEPLVIQEVLTALRRQSLPCVIGDPLARDRLEEALHDARVLASSIMAQAEARRARVAADSFRAFSQRARAAVLAVEASLSQAAMEHLPALGVEACVVAVLSTPGDVVSEARVLFGFGPGGRLATVEKIPLGSLVAHSLLQRRGRTLIMLPIVAAGQPLGAAVLAVTSINGALLDELRDLFGTLLAVSTLQQGTSVSRQLAVV